MYATDVHTGMVIRCKVYIDNFSRIQIFHSSIKLDLGGLGTLRVRAFDSEGKYVLIMMLISSLESTVNMFKYICFMLMYYVNVYLCTDYTELLQPSSTCYD